MFGAAGFKEITERQRDAVLPHNLEDKRMASRLIRNHLPERVAGSTPVSSATGTAVTGGAFFCLCTPEGESLQGLASILLSPFG